MLSYAIDQCLTIWMRSLKFISYSKLRWTNHFHLYLFNYAWIDKFHCVYIISAVLILVYPDMIIEKYENYEIDIVMQKSLEERPVSGIFRGGWYYYHHYHLLVLLSLQLGINFENPPSWLRSFFCACPNLFLCRGTSLPNAHSATAYLLILFCLCKWKKATKKSHVSFLAARYADDAISSPYRLPFLTIMQIYSTED